eukprot:COSAG01_NODE_662_length_14431_cov_31.385775_2_plen_389_part_00
MCIVKKYIKLAYIYAYMMKKNKQPLFIAATRQNDGKTMVSLGLYQALYERLGSLGYMKPVGQQYRVIDNEKIDKDALLFKKVFRIDDKLRDMSPIAVEKGFTLKAIQEQNVASLVKRIKDAEANLYQSNDYLLIEGTGHAGVGSVFSLSNAVCAKVLNANALLVAIGGIGKAIDEIMLNKALFDQEKVNLKGVIINKVREDKLEKVEKSLSTYCSRQGLKIYGYIPFIDALIKPTIAGIFEFLKEDVISGECNLLNKVDQVMIGDMSPHDIFDSLNKETLLIVPTNREGVIMTALLGNIVNKNEKNKLAGVIFTGKRPPHQNIIDLMKQTNTPALIARDNSYEVTQKINSLLVKLRHEEYDKIEAIKNLIKKHVNIDAILKDYYDISL